MAAGNLHGWAVDKTTQSFKLSLFAAPTPTAVWGSKIMLFLSKCCLIISKVSFSSQLSEIKSFWIMSKFDFSILYSLFLTFFIISDVMPELELFT